MPRRRDRRLSNGCYRKKTYRNTQREYRLTRGLTSNNVTLRLCFQTEITHVILARKSILHNANNSCFPPSKYRYAKKLII